MTVAPSAMNNFAVAAPIPDAAPVMRAILSSSFPIFVTSRGGEFGARAPHYPAITLHRCSDICQVHDWGRLSVSADLLARARVRLHRPQSFGPGGVTARAAGKIEH